MYFCDLMMLIGVISFSFANGTLASIISNQDNQSAIYEQKLEILNKAKVEYELDQGFYLKVKKTIKYSSLYEQDELNEFIDQLPSNLRSEMALRVFDKKY